MMSQPHKLSSFHSIEGRRVGFGLLLLLFFALTGNAWAQTASPNVVVDEQGVLRWSSGEEIHGFGVNYTVPFAHAWRSAQKLGVDPLRAIDQDVYHFARLGFDLYRVHVWDTEISDTLGNLLFNEHLHAFDYLLHKLAERNIRYVLTPIAYWGNGWPEPDEATPGFSAKYGKGNCLTNPAAIAAQENYLTQFMHHVNPYTGVAYKDDPNLIAVEISNEPHHREAPEKVTAFVARMVKAVRQSGYAKPIFYNISHSVHLVDAYFEGGIQGGTFQWYPTGLGYQRELEGNMLPNVDHYLIPFDDRIKAHQGAKLVYEFDAADVGRSYIYPAMARSFRKAGIQIATHFAYDPSYLAYANTEYNTHYMNLAYAPQKALSLMIAGEVFHQVPMYKDYGSYPDNRQFEGFSVSYEDDLAMLNMPEKYYYTHHSTTAPLNESALEHIAGSGNSPLVEYEGTGAYFLDKVQSGVWRLEVMPDALIVGNPYGRNSLDKTVTVIQWNERKIRLLLKELGEDFSIAPLNAGNDYQPSVAGNRVMIRPGTYLLQKKGTTSRWNAQSRVGNLLLGEFHAPRSSVDKTYLIHQAPNLAIAGNSLTIRAQVAAPEAIQSVQLWLQGPAGGRPIEMQWQGGFDYTAEIPAERIVPGRLRYYLVVQGKTQSMTFPAGQQGTPYQWDFYARTPWEVRVIDASQPISLFQAQNDWDALSFSRWSRGFSLVPLDDPNESGGQIRIEKLFEPDAENLNGSVIHDLSLRHYLLDELAPIRAQLSSKSSLILKARSLGEAPTYVQVALVMQDGQCYGKVVKVGPKMSEIAIPLRELQKVKTVSMPRPYPTFLPYYFEGSETTAMDISQLEAVQISIGPGIPANKLNGKQEVELVSLMLR